jgi:medium-chain acyl-[acyl-carrier-protein] hydrolase
VLGGNGIVSDVDGSTVPWFVPLVEDSDRPVRILGMPQAGAGCAAFADCAGKLAPDVAMWSLNLPGRQARFNEPPRTEIDSLVKDVAAEMHRYTDRPYVMFGNCSGAVLAYLLVQAIRGLDLPGPQAMVVVSYPAPHLARPPRELHTLPSDQFWEEIISYGGVPAELVSQPDYREIFEPAMRADHAVLAGFHYERQQPLDVPVVVVAGRDDPVCQASDLLAWRLHTTRRFSLHLLDSAHWVMEAAESDVVRVLDDVCRR